MDKEIVPLEGCATSLPFSTAVRCGDFLFLSGMVSKDLATDEARYGSIEDETRKALDNIRQVLEKAGSSLDKVVKATVYLTDINTFAAMNAVYREFFTDALPARSTVGIQLAGEYKVEIEVIAAV